MTIRVWYHAGCWDGFGAAWAVHLAAQDSDWDQLAYREIHYGAPLPPYDPGDQIWFLDFSPKVEQLAGLLEGAEHVLIIDHHKTAIEALDSIERKGLEKILALDHSGARLAWDHFHPMDDERPVVIDYIEDRDLWRHELPHSKAFNANLRSYARTFEQWKNFRWLYDSPAEVDANTSWVEEGYAILREQERSILDHLGRAAITLLDGKEVPYVNATEYFSEIAGRLAENHESGIGVAWFQRQDGRYQYSLRSRGDADVSEIAEGFGGGGHAKAAGFELDEPPLYFKAARS